MSQEEALIWIAEIFEQPAGSIKPETPREEIAAWDSLGFLMLMAELDEKQGILLSDTELRALAKVGDILAVLRRAGKLQENLLA